MGQNQSQNRPADAIPSPNYDLPPLTFHSIHGENITLSNDGAIATRQESYCKGILFSHRPVMVGERVCLKICELSTRWSGVIRVGFSNHDPTILRDGLPKYACPDLTNKQGYWAKAVSDRFLETNAVIHFFVSSHGDVHFGINGGDLGVFFSGIDTRKPLWAMIDLYGNCTQIALVDPRRATNNFSRGKKNCKKDIQFELTECVFTKKNSFSQVQTVLQQDLHFDLNINNKSKIKDLGQMYLPTKLCPTQWHYLPLV